MTTVATAVDPTSGLPASRGLQWWSSAITWLFSGGGQLGVWVLMSLAFIVLSLLMRFIPLFGLLVSLPLHFAFSGGLMLAASRSAQAVRRRSATCSPASGRAPDRCLPPEH